MERESSLAHRAREAKSKSHELRDLLKQKADPSDPDVEFLRESLRRLYLSVLFADRTASPSTTPSTGRLLDVLGLLWIETSHAFIHSHRQRVAALDKEAKKGGESGKGRRNRGSKEAGDRAAGRRKLVHSLRGFLAAEETFWSSTIARIVESYDVRDAEPAIRALKISMAPLIVRTESDGDVKEALVRQQGLLLVHRALICFGDLARYRELYSESTSLVEKELTQPRSYARAAECYHQARLLIPDDGNPSNQLAVLASYSQDQLASVYHYYRALTVRNAFPTARQNLEVTFTKALSTHNAVESEDIAIIFVGIHARLFLQTQLAEVPPLSSRGADLLSAGLVDRTHASETVVQLLVLALAAWWDSRMQQADRNSSAEVEALALAHVHTLIAVLHKFFADDVSKIDVTTADAAAESADPDAFASLISSELRRVLPAVRIASKWLLRHVEDARDSHALETLWPVYVRAANALADYFPIHTLPQLPKDSSFEEDVDMVAFLPLGASSQHSSGPTKAAAPFVAAQPEQEHLMRIADLMADQHLLAHGQGSPIALDNEVFVCIPPELAATFSASRHATLRNGDGLQTTPKAVNVPLPTPIAQATLHHAEQSLLHSSVANGSGDEDDIVGEAFRAVSLGQGQDDDRALFPSAAPARKNGVLPPPNGQSQPRNAQDLLFSVLGDSPRAGVPSIWAPTSTDRAPQLQPQQPPARSIPEIWAPQNDPQTRYQPQPAPPPGLWTGLSQSAQAFVPQHQQQPVYQAYDPRYAHYR